MHPLALTLVLMAPPAACRFERFDGPAPAELCAAWAKGTRNRPQGMETETTDCTLTASKPAPFVALGPARLTTFEAEMAMAGRPRFVVLVLAVVHEDRWYASPLASSYDSGQAYAGATVAAEALTPLDGGLVAVRVRTGAASGDVPGNELTTSEGAAVGWLEVGAAEPVWLGAVQTHAVTESGPIEGDGKHRSRRRETSVALEAGTRRVTVAAVAGKPFARIGPHALAELRHRCPFQVPLPGRLD